MALAPGDRIGIYEVVSLLGKGGMGEVYRAHDPSLNRDVAIKVLPSALANDADYLARFQREAQTLASLNHPNIAAIYGLEGKAIVMELVEGSTLQGPLPLADALPLARQIAEALEAAHEKGIIHRDLKPGNVKVTPEGVVKVLDFGLAKAVNERPVSTGPDSPTLTMRATEAGLILGTAGYMSPEQAAGKNVDRRADIWSFGVVLYELLTGKRLFDGETVTHTLADVVRAPIDLTGVPLQGLIGRCLDRNIKTRLQHIGEARIAIETYRETAPAARKREMSWLPWAATTAVLAGVAGWALLRTPAVPAPQLVHVDMDLGRNAQLSLTTTGPNFAISADGRRIVVLVSTGNGAPMLGTRTLDQNQLTVLQGTESAATPFLSPDGQWVAFASGGKLKKVSVTGGGAIPLCDVAAFRGGVWTGDGNLVVALGTRESLSILPASGGTPQPLTKLTGADKTHRWPALGPGGAILFMNDASPGDYEDAVIEAVWPRTGQRTIVRRGGYFPQYTASEHLLFMSQGTLMAARLDREKLTLLHDPAAVRANVEGGPGYGCANLQVSGGGTLLYRTGAASLERGFSWADGGGKTESIPIQIANYVRMQLSPDGKRIAATTTGGVLSVIDIERKLVTRLLSTPGVTGGKIVWSRNGRHLFYRTDKGIFAIPYDGSRDPIQLTSGQLDFPGDLTADSSKLYFNRNTEYRILELDWTDSTRPKPGTDEKLPLENGVDIEISLDGKWLAYLTQVGSGRPELFVRPRDAKAGGKWQISANGATAVKWSPNGRELLFTDFESRIYSVPFTVAGDAFVAGQSKLWPTPGRAPGIRDFGTDGKRLIYATNVREGEEASPLTLELNFAEELLQRKDLASK